MLALNYAISHGIEPGVAHLKTLPQLLTSTILPYGGEVTNTGGTGGVAGFKQIGDLIITDGVEKVVVPDCRVVAIYSDGSNGTEWNFKIEDRRWRWRECGTISGKYNQLDEHAKLIPWTIRSPLELVMLCLDAMGELRSTQLLGQTTPNFQIDVPPGLDSSVGKLAWMLNPPWIGVATPTRTNPPINWVNEKPMHALQNLCEIFGRRLIYRLSTNSVMIAVPGIGGAKLPDGSISSYSPATEKPVVPSGVAVFGSPTRYQTRLPLVAVGKEWDGSYRPIDFLSYRPRGNDDPGVAQVTTCSVINPQVGVNFRITINGVLFEVSSSGTDASATVTAIISAINASSNTDISGVVTAGNSAPIDNGQSFTVTAAVAGVSFSVDTTISGAGGTNARFLNFTFTAAQPGVSRPGSWRYETPGKFEGCRQTSRLTRLEAIELAKESVFRDYQLANQWPGGLPISVPGYGRIVRRQQIVLLPTRVEQVVPEPQDATLIRPGTSLPFTVNLYDGYSRDKPAIVYGSHVQRRGQIGFWTGRGSANQTDRTDQVFVPFVIDPKNQLVKFSDYVYREYRGDNVNRQSTVCSLPFIPAVGATYTVTINNLDFSYTVTSPLQTTVDIITSLVSDIRDETLLEGVVTVQNVTATSFTVIASQLNVSFSITTTVDNPLTDFPSVTSHIEVPQSAPAERHPSELVLETAVHVRNASTNNLEQFYKFQHLVDGNQATPPIVELHEDVQLNLIGEYDQLEPQTITGFRVLDGDANARASYYLAGMLHRFFNRNSYTVTYNGIRAIDVDAEIHQITWDIGDQGGTTTVSKNMEHSVWVPTYQRRRLREFLEPLRERIVNQGLNPQRSFLPPGNDDVQ